MTALLGVSTDSELVDAPAAAPPAAKAPKVAPADRDDGVDAPLSVTKVKDSVQVRREYPKEEETQELVDVTVFSEEDENNVRLYGNNITKTTRPAAESVKDAIGLGDE